jgi:hypothetical protein
MFRSEKKNFMFRNENELLKGLLNAIKNTKYVTNLEDVIKKPEPLSNKEKEDMEKYRDMNGNINLTKVKDMDEVNRIVDIVDRKNNEELNESNKSIFDDIFGMLDTSIKNGINYTVKISPDGIKIKSNEDFFEEHDDVNDKKNVPVYSEGEPVTYDETKSVVTSESLGEVVGEVKKTLKEYDNEEVIVLLDDVGGAVYNPLFYNAVRHICETQYFPINGVYTYQEIEPKESDIAILLPNVWGKITGEFIKTYEEYMENGGKVFVIDPESFECEEIKHSSDLWNFEMSIVQEEMI